MCTRNGTHTSCAVKLPSTESSQHERLRDAAYTAFALMSILTQETAPVRKRLFHIPPTSGIRRSSISARHPFTRTFDALVLLAAYCGNETSETNTANRKGVYIGASMYIRINCVPFVRHLCLTTSISLSLECFFFCRVCSAFPLRVGPSETSVAQRALCCLVFEARV